MAIRGIDVASYQSETPDLSGMDFVFVKATEGTSYINPKQRAQAAHARKHGRVVGFYAFLRPGSMKAQAAYFVRECASRHGDPLWADWEDNEVSCADKDDFLREVVRLRGDTHRVGLYCNTNFWLHRDTTSYCADALWIATYNGHPGHPGIRHKWLFHQYTSSPIDTSVSTFTSRSALKTWCTKTKAKTPAHEAPSTSTSKETDMEMHDSVTLNDWMPPRWDDLRDGHITVQTALGSGYGHARRAADAGEAALVELKALRVTVDKLADAVGTAGQFDPAALKQEIRQAIESVTATVTIDTKDA